MRLRIAKNGGLCPHVKNHPLGGWMFIFCGSNENNRDLQIAVYRGAPVLRGSLREGAVAKRLRENARVKTFCSHTRKSVCYRHAGSPTRLRREPPPGGGLMERKQTDKLKFEHFQSSVLVGYSFTFHCPATGSRRARMAVNAGVSRRTSKVGEDMKLIRS